MEETKITLIKLTDDYFNGEHPNKIYEGHTEVGYIKRLPKIGERFYVRQKSLYSFITSIVTKELDENNVFKTTYSTYKIEYDEK